MIRYTTWRPDTCSCAIEYAWDTDDPPNARQHTPVRIVAQCSEHAEAVTPQDLLDDLQDENPRVNRAKARLLQAFPAKLGMTDDSGKVVLDPSSYSYAITGKRGSRVLTLTLPRLTAAEKTAVQSWANNNIGAGRVVVK